MDTTRRALLVAGAAAASFKAVAAFAQTGRQDDRPSPLDGELRFDQTSRAAAADDFGHLVHRTPAAVLLPGSDRDVATTIRWAAKRGFPIAPQGQSHSVFGRSQAQGGIVIDMSRLQTVHRVAGDHVVVDAGATWSQVLAATLPQGLAPPVLTDYLELSVGGTLIVGGVGAMTSQHGVQADNVLEMDVITGTGEKLTCSLSRQPDLFNAVRAGLGQVGVITRATLALTPAPQQIRRYLLIYRDLQSFVNDERLLSADHRFDAVQGAVLPTPTGWTFRLDAVKAFSTDPPDDSLLLAGLADERAHAQLSTLSYAGYLNRLAALEQALRANGQWFFPHPWLTTFVGDAAVESLVGRELELLEPADLGPLGQIVLSPFRRQAVSSPLLRLPADDLVYAFNFVRIPATDDRAGAERLVSANRATFERVGAQGGTLYPVSAFPMSRNDWRRHFGPAFHQLRDAKRIYDPGNVLTPGYDIFGRRVGQQ
jgi:FAD/FMN-containing dehydrogenase